MKRLAPVLLWWVYFPLIRILIFFISWLPDIQERRRFERKNLTERLAQSFKAEGLVADICFEFSSEGEYQQVAPLIEDALLMGKKVELVFFSPSVEKTITELATKFPLQLRYFRYPLVKFSAWNAAFCFSKWVSSSELVMVRYDLFPEFLVWAMDPAHKLKMVWVTFKKEREKNKSIPWIKRAFLRQACCIFYASDADREQGAALGAGGETYDFRMEQIRRRIGNKTQKFSRQFPLYAKFQEQLQLFPREKRLIMGNVWPHDMHLISRLPKDILLVVVPHQLTAEILESIHDTLEAAGRMPQEIASDTTELQASNSYLVNQKGILCELYSDFGKAYVGGGFGESVHSILEPLVAGAEHISAGPVHHRSTEYDVALSLEQMTEVKDQEDFNRWLVSQLPADGALVKIQGFFDHYPRFRKDIISC